MSSSDVDYTYQCPQSRPTLLMNNENSPMKRANMMVMYKKKEFKKNLRRIYFKENGGTDDGNNRTCDASDVLFLGFGVV
jgi:hypothetical protein